MIEIKNISKKFGNIIALDNISLKINKGEFFGLLGPNGAGKTTLMNLITAYLKPDNGEIEISGQKVSPENKEIRTKIGLVPQNIALYEDLSAQTNLEIFGDLYDIEKKYLKEIIAHRLNQVGLYDRKKYAVKTFSGGMKRRLNLVAALLHEPSILLCDEPTVGVDPQSRNAIFDFLQELNEKGVTIIYSTHYMEEAERMCSQLGIIDSGKIIAEGNLQELIKLLPYRDLIIIPKADMNEKQTEQIAAFENVKNENNKFVIEIKKVQKLSEVIIKLENIGINTDLIEVSKPTLEELFLSFTGRRMRD